MKWTNIKTQGMPSYNGEYLITDGKTPPIVTKYLTVHKVFHDMPYATHWHEYTPPTCKCGRVDNTDYCMKGDCYPF